MTLQDHLQDALEKGQIINFTHGPGCPDGKTCAALVQRAYGNDKVCLVYAQPAKLDKIFKTFNYVMKETKPTKPVTLLVTDLGLNDGTKDTIKNCLEKLKKHHQIHIYWIDHHAPSWTEEDEQDLAKHCEQVILERTAKRDCGATLTRKFLAKATAATHPGLIKPTKPMDTPRLKKAVAAIAKRDTWSDPDDQQAIRLGLAAFNLKDEYITRFANLEFKYLENIGKEAQKQTTQWVLNALGRIKHHTDEVAYITGPAPISDVADNYWKVGYANILLHFNTKGVVSLRARPGYPICAELAKQNDGGGHAYAAGFSIRDGRKLNDKLYRLWMKIRGAKHPQIKQALTNAEQILEQHKQTPFPEPE